MVISKTESPAGNKGCSGSQFQILQYIMESVNKKMIQRLSIESISDHL